MLQEKKKIGLSYVTGGLKSIIYTHVTYETIPECYLMSSTK